MTYPVQPRWRRPASVTTAVVLLFVAALALLVMALSQVLIIGPVGRAVEAVSAEPGEGTALIAVIFGGAAGLNALFAVALGVLAPFDLAGKQPARVLTWIVAPLAMLCCGCGSGVYTKPFFTSAGSGPPTAGEEVSQEQLAAIGTGMPGWYSAAVLVAVVVIALAVLGAVICLAVPASNPHFRPVPQGWLPGTWPPPPGGFPPGFGVPPGGFPPGGSSAG